jgi:penicillin-binding protein 1A
LSIRHGRFKTFIMFTLYSALFSIAAGFGLLLILTYQVFFGDMDYLKKSTIIARIHEETSIYYADEDRRIGSFFEDRHRRYVGIDEIPDHMVHALIAAEDKYYYDHIGVNPIAIAKAIGEGVAGIFKSRLRNWHFRGGSTITQQTVKNILDKHDYTLTRKFKEAVAALQLERLYSKRQILEFYFNQFHVTANGTGIGIAAKYYFNKEVSELNLIEAAFIAGSVKGPSRYNPFMKFTPEDRERATTEAFHRKNYVLRQMYEKEWISAEEFQDAFEAQVPFNRGAFTSKQVALVSLISSQMKRQELLNAVGLETHEDLQKAGYRIFTTLDYDMQQNAQLEMRRNLSRLETILNGFSPEPEEEFKRLRSLEVGEFYYGRVVKREGGLKNLQIHVDFGLPKGVIPHESIIRYAKKMDIALHRGHEFHIRESLAKIKEGDIVFAEVLEYDPQTHQSVLELQKRPDVNGAMVVLDRGDVKAVVSGFDAQGYNRAIFGRRQPGSVFKSVIYFAAMQLGWSLLDRTPNERQVFSYQGQFYYPSPDHDTPYNETSMIWSGVKSENLATIALTTRLVDKLNFSQFKQLMELMGIHPQGNEPAGDYHFRTARRMGVSIDNQGIKEHLLQEAISDLEADLVFSGDEQTVRELRKMWWGRGYLSEVKNIYATELTDRFTVRERDRRLEMLKNNFERMRLLESLARSDWALIKDRLTQGVNDDTFREALSHFRITTSRRLVYDRVLDGESPQSLSDAPTLPPQMVGRALNRADVEAIWGESAQARHAGIHLGSLRLGGYLPVERFGQLEDAVESRFNEVISENTPFGLHRYFYHHDFRIALGLNYVKYLCEQMGVFSPLDPVLSFALGTNVISAAEVAKVYQTFIDGKIYKFYEEGPANQLNFIKRIEDRHGNMLYEPLRREHQLVNPNVAYQMHEILRRVITNGTGVWARGELYLKVPTTENKRFTPIRLPAYGKTGTTNDYLTATFAGFFPYPTQVGAPLDPRNAYTISSYVGYDLNKEMRRGGFRVSGASGALPAWTYLAKSITESQDYLGKLDTSDLSILQKQEWPMQLPSELLPFNVDLPRGIVANRSTEDEEIYGTTDFATTGEEFINEFAVVTPVNVKLMLPHQNNRPLRSVSFFQPQDATGGIESQPVEVRIEAPRIRVQDPSLEELKTQRMGTRSEVPPPTTAPQAQKNWESSTATEQREAPSRPVIEPSPQPSIQPQKPSDEFSEEDLW